MNVEIKKRECVRLLLFSNQGQCTNTNSTANY